MKRSAISLMFLACLVARPADAALITYAGQLFDGVAVAGVNNQAPSNSGNPVGAEYYYFYATAGSNVTVVGDRLAGHYDMAFWVFSGLYNDTDDFGPAFPGLAALNLIDFGDDEDPANIAGPFGDPNVNFLAPVTGYYTVAVTNFASSADPPNPFQLVATGIGTQQDVVPEPSTLVMFCLGAAGAAVYGRRRKRGRSLKA